MLTSSSTSTSTLSAWWAAWNWTAAVQTAGWAASAAYTASYHRHNSHLHTAEKQETQAAAVQFHTAPQVLNELHVQLCIMYKSCIDFRKPTSQGRRFSSKLGRVPFPDPLSLTPFPFLLLLPPFPSTPPKSNCRKLAGEWCKWPGLSIGCRRMSISMYFRLAGDDFHLVTNFSPWQLGQVHWRAGPNRCEKWSGPDPRSGWKLMPLLQVINSSNMIWSEAPFVYNNQAYCWDNCTNRTLSKLSNHSLLTTSSSRQQFQWASSEWFCIEHTQQQTRYRDVIRIQ